MWSPSLLVFPPMCCLPRPSLPSLPFGRLFCAVLIRAVPRLCCGVLQLLIGGGTALVLLVSLSNPPLTGALAKDDESVPTLPIATEVSEHWSEDRRALVGGRTGTALWHSVSPRPLTLQVDKAAFSECCRTPRTFPLVTLLALGPNSQCSSR